MNVTHNPPGNDLSADIARLLDERYEVKFSTLPALFPGYVVELTGPLGSTWLGGGETPAAALRSQWPLGDDTTDADPDADEAAVLDGPEPTCAVCGGPVGIFDSSAGQWEHFRIVRHVVETFDAGHAPQVADTPAGGA